MGRRAIRHVNNTLEEAPVYYPTEEEFAHPLRYIASIRERAEKYGVCKVVPPPDWNPPFALDWENLRFKTKVQAIHQLQERPAGCDPNTFRLEYQRFCDREGLVLRNWPKFDGDPLDLCRLYNAVKRRGGYVRVSREKKWMEVLRMVTPDKVQSGVSGAASLAAQLSQLYSTFLSLYEKHHSHPGEPLNITSAWREKFLKSQSNPSNLGKHHSKNMVKQEENDVVSGPCQEPKERSVKLNPFVEKHGLHEVLVSLPITLKEGSIREIEESLDKPAKRMKILQEEAQQEEEVEEWEKPLEATPRNDQRCEQCHGGGHEEAMLLCDRCDRGRHLYCLSPPLSSIPDGNWYCQECLNSEQESFGFCTGEEHTLKSFHRMADKFKRKWFGSDAKFRSLTPAEIEAEFWRIVERSTQPVEVLYGSDIDTSVSGSGFPRKSDPCPPGRNKQQWQKYANSPWNLNNMPKTEGSMLRHVDDNIPGVIVPWLYVGMTFSSFCWHFEDHCFYSINYLHWGEPKLWYGVPGSAAEAFETVMKQSFPDLFEAQPDLLFQLVTMLSPSVLKDNRVPVYTCLQEPRQFVITFPRSYHGGFNYGFNCAEAVNFAPPDWFPWGGCGVERYRLFRRSAILSHEELLCVVAKSGEYDLETRQWLHKELQRVVEGERKLRYSVWARGTNRSQRLPGRAFPDRISSDEDPECIICRYYLHLSAVTCACRPGEAVCLQHSQQLCECPPSRNTLMYRHSLAELDDMLATTHTPPTPPPPSASAKGPKGSLTLRSSARLSHPVAASSASSPADCQAGRRAGRGGRLLSHSECAAQWVARARGSLRDPPSLAHVAELLEECEAYLWGGHDTDAVREVEQRLSEAKQWADAVAACCGDCGMGPAAGSGTAMPAHAVPPASSSSSSLTAAPAAAAASGGAGGRDTRGRGVPLSRVEALLAVDPAPCLGSRVQELQDLHSKALALQERMQHALAASPPYEFRLLHALQLEALRGPIEVPQVKDLKEAMHKAQLWSDSVRKVLPTTKSVRRRAQSDLPTIGHLAELQEQGASLKVRMAEHALLESAMAKASAWQHKAMQLLPPSSTSAGAGQAEEEAEEGGGVLQRRRQKPSLSSVTALLQALEDIPVGMFAEMEALHSMAARATQWESERWQLLGKGSWRGGPGRELNGGASAVSAAQLGKLLEEGRQLDVEVELDTLESEFQVLAWAEEAGKALTTKCSMEHLQHLLQEAEKLHVSSSEVAAQVEATVEAACEWEGKAEKALAGGATMDDFLHLLRSSEGLPVCLPAVPALSHAVEAAKRWSDAAQAVVGLVRGRPTRGRHHRSHHTLLPAGTGTVPSTSTAAAGNGSHAAGVVSVDVLRSLAASMADLRVALKETEVVKARLAEAEAWQAHAQRQLALPPPAPPPAPAPRQDEGTQGNGGGEAGGGVVGEVLVHRVASLQAVLEDGVSLGVLGLPELQQVQEEIVRCEWDIRALAALTLQQQSPGKGGNSSSSSSNSLEVAEAVVSDGHKLTAQGVAIDVRALKRLEASVKDTRDWLAKASHIAPRRQLSDAYWSVEELKGLLEASQSLVVDVRGESERLATLLHSHRTWTQRVRMSVAAARDSSSSSHGTGAAGSADWVGSSGGSSSSRSGVDSLEVVSVEDLQRLMLEGDAMGAHCPELTQLLPAAMEALRAWMGECEGSVRKQQQQQQQQQPGEGGGGGGAAGLAQPPTLLTLLHKMLRSLEAALLVIGCTPPRLVESGRAGAGPCKQSSFPSPSAAPPPPPALMCACLSPPDHSGTELRSMVCCESCNDKFHVGCIWPWLPVGPSSHSSGSGGGSSSSTRLRSKRSSGAGAGAGAGKRFTCAFCAALCTGSLDITREARDKIHATCRPSLETLRRLRKASESLPCRTEETEVLARILPAAEQWEEEATRLLRPVLELPRGSSPLTGPALVKLLKAANAVEVCWDDAGLVDRAVAAHAWRVRACDLLLTSAKPSIDSLARLLKEGSALVGHSDGVLLEARQRETSAREWIQRAKQVVESDNSGSLGIDNRELEEIITSAEQLPVSFETELKVLRGLLELHCVCQQRFNPVKSFCPMLECTSCHQWYHYTCLNLPAPQPDEPAFNLGPMNRLEKPLWGEESPAVTAQVVESGAFRLPVSETCEETRESSKGTANCTSAGVPRITFDDRAAYVCPDCVAMALERERSLTEDLKLRAVLLQQRTAALMRKQKEREMAQQSRRSSLLELVPAVSPQLEANETGRRSQDAPPHGPSKSTTSDFTEEHPVPPPSGLLFPVVKGKRSVRNSGPYFDVPRCSSSADHCNKTEPVHAKGHCTMDVLKMKESHDKLCSKNLVKFNPKSSGSRVSLFEADPGLVKQSSLIEYS